jgi:transposase InsO family protein
MPQRPARNRLSGSSRGRRHHLNTMALSAVRGSNQVWVIQERVCVQPRRASRNKIRRADNGEGPPFCAWNPTRPSLAGNPQFQAPRPNALWVSNFTYAATWAGFVYVAFVIDTFARRIVGWRASRTAHAGFVLDALDQALCDRRGNACVYSSGLARAACGDRRPEHEEFVTLRHWRPTGRSRGLSTSSIRTSFPMRYRNLPSGRCDDRLNPPTMSRSNTRSA